jgi:hypothetical protein
MNWNELKILWKKVSMAAPNIVRMIKSRRIRLTGHVACMRAMRNAYNILVVKPEGRRTLGRSRRRWKDNIKLDLRETGLEGVDLINVAQDRDQWWAVVNTVMNLDCVRDY